MLRAVTRRASAWSVIAAVLAVVAADLGAGVAGGQPADAPGLSLVVSGSPVRDDGSGPGLTVRVSLTTPSTLTLRVVDFDDRTVQVLFEGGRQAGTLTRRWWGRDTAGRPVAEGPYRVEATAIPVGAARDAMPLRGEAWATVADRPIYPVGPGVITVVVDPGHGGPFDGAVAPDGTREADLNLDTGLRLARMLEGAGVRVVLTRDADEAVNTPAIDRVPNGMVDVTDDLAARVDIANAARADLFIAVHDNFAVDHTTGGPSTYYSGARTFSDRSALLAQLVQANMVAGLATVAGGHWQPYDHGALTYPYYVLRDYDPPRLLRPSRMPGVLSEGLFLSNPRELRLLKLPRVRQAMANAYYRAIAEYLSRRGSQIGYSLVSAPTEVGPGATFDLEVEVRDQGSTDLRGWRLVVGAQPAGSTDLGRGRPGATIGGRRLPALERAERRTLRVRVTAPSVPGAWVLQVDAQDGNGVRASRAGSPMLEVPLDVGAVPSGLPVATPSLVPSSSPLATPTSWRPTSPRSRHALSGGSARGDRPGGSSSARRGRTRAATGR
jgi:N-acetylmuramoyl-L-alanine amidase